MTKKEIKETSKKLYTFIQMCENYFEEDEHKVKTPLTYDDFEAIQTLTNKLKNCVEYVDGCIFD